MNDDSGLSTYLAILVGVMLLAGALVLSRRETGAGGPATATGPVPAVPPTATGPERSTRPMAGRNAVDRRRRVVGLARCALLAVLAVVLAAWQWESPDS